MRMTEAAAHAPAQSSPAESAVAPMIDLQGVTKRYGEKVAVSNLTLRIPAGELFACLGPNGAGKTTTIKMVTGLLRPTSGRVLVAGTAMSADAHDARRLISYIPDQPFVYEKLTGREFLQFTRDIYGIAGPQVDAREEKLIGVFEMDSYVDDLAETYSHGMRQRLAFVAALIHEPKVLIVDEPMVGLDPKSMRIVKDLLRDSAREGAAVFMSTHTLAIAEEVADRIGIIHCGELIRCGTLEELRRQGAGGMSLEDFFLKVTAQSESPPEPKA